MTSTRLSEACYRYDGHKACAGCACECHDANPNCFMCSGTGSYPDSLPEFIVCGCVTARRRSSERDSR